VACFTDQENDRESGLTYYGARYYDPWVGRIGWNAISSSFFLDG